MEAIGAGYEESMCYNIRKMPGFKHKSIIVGHCPTTFDHFTDKKTAEGGTNVGEEYDGCLGNMGCVVSACDLDKETKIIFVDTSLSSAFRNPTSLQEEKARDSEMIVLTHINNDDPYGRYYNEIKRVRTTGIQYIVYPLSKSFEWISVEEARKKALKTLKAKLKARKPIKPKGGVRRITRRKPKT